MKIISLRFYGKPNKNFLSYCSVTFDFGFCIEKVKIVADSIDPSRLLVLMPSHQTVEGKYRDVCHPTTKEFRTLLEATVLEGYKKNAAAVLK